MSVADIPILLEVPGRSHGRLRLNLTSQVVSMPHPKPMLLAPQKRNNVQYYVTLAPINDTFAKKHLPVAMFPETTKLGRPTGTRHKPDVTNGYFDLRVLSRNHAQIFIDPQLGKLMLQDLGLSNGTYLNDFRLGLDPVEIKIGDHVCLGFNVQLELTHKQIALRVDNINVVRNDYHLTLFNTTLNLNLPQYKHLSFIEDIYKRVMEHEQTSQDDTDTSLDIGLFGDINPAIEDDLLGLFSESNAGIYNNLAITNLLTFELIVNTLVADLTKIKQQNNTLRSLYDFLAEYHTKLNNLNTQYLDRQLQKTIDRMEAELAREKLHADRLEQRCQAQEAELRQQADMLGGRIKELEAEVLRLNMLVQAQKIPAPSVRLANDLVDLLLLKEIQSNGHSQFGTMDLFQFVNGDIKSDREQLPSPQANNIPITHDLTEFFNQPSPLRQLFLANGAIRHTSGEISPVMSRSAPEEFPLTTLLPPEKTVIDGDDIKEIEDTSSLPSPPRTLVVLEKTINDETTISITVVACIALVLGYLIQKVTN